MLTKDNREMPEDERRRTQRAAQPQHTVNFDGCKFVCDGAGTVVRGKKNDLIDFRRSGIAPPGTTITFAPGTVVQPNGQPLPHDQIILERSPAVVKMIGNGGFRAEKAPGCPGTEPPKQETTQGTIHING
jgi:hypothetical protein